jgi:hypothetical protein
MRLGAIRLLLATLLVATLAPAPGPAGELTSLPDERLGIRTAPLLLLSRVDVRADLALDPSQTTAALKAVSELHAKARTVQGLAGEKAVAARREIDEEERRWINDHLSEKQARRLAQVDLQWEGPSALISRPIVADALKLTDAQRAALKRAIDEHRVRRAPGTLVLGEEKRLAEQALATLSEEQKKMWFSILGPPFAPQIAEAPRVPSRR